MNSNRLTDNKKSINLLSITESDNHSTNCEIFNIMRTEQSWGAIHLENKYRTSSDAAMKKKTTGLQGYSVRNLIQNCVKDIKTRSFNHHLLTRRKYAF